ncbi:MAG TPA: single-stranded DNA-binding protein [Actinomycetes bacterium]|nr:single-stranded DNA-binding protein [Actinomycetes bacterium]
MNEIFVTVNGTVGSDVKTFDAERSRGARFRLATAEHFFDRDKGEWVQRETVWMDVVCWKRLADHVKASVRKGQPVIVRGRLRVTHYETDKGPRQGIEVIATSIGHDLTYGDATFSRPQRENRADRVSDVA